MHPLRVLGVDPGSRVCGYAVITASGGARYGYVECGVLTTADGAADARLGELARSLTEVVRELAPAALAVEDCFSHAAHPRSALVLAQARGVVLAVAGLAGIPVYSYPPATVKKCVTGRGAASKEQVARMVMSLIGLERPPRADAADALAVAITHALRLA